MASAAESVAAGLGGGLASVFARTLVYPLDVLRTVYVTKGRAGVRALAPRDLYRGLGCSKDFLCHWLTPLCYYLYGGLYGGGCK
jgi:hypothetical protein